MKRFNRLQRLLASAIFTLGAAATAWAAPVVRNGGFETGDFSSWTQFGASNFDVVTCASPSAFVHEGNCAASFAAFGAASSIEQLIDGLNAGTDYRISFALLTDGMTPSSFRAEFGASTLLDLSNPTGAPYVGYSFVHRAGAGSEMLRLSARNDFGFVFLDAVSVSPVPEPATLSLVALGVAVLLGRLRHARTV